MTGHERILKLRRAGRKPAFVRVTDHCVKWLDGLTVSVVDDTPELLDLRFLVGVTALVEGPDQARVDRIAEACKPFAARVIATTIPGSTVTRITDTAGIATWPIRFSTTTSTSRRTRKRPTTGRTSAAPSCTCRT